MLLSQGMGVPFLLQTCFSPQEQQDAFLYESLFKGNSYRQAGELLNRSVKYVYGRAQYFMENGLLSDRKWVFSRDMIQKGSL